MAIGNDIGISPEKVSRLTELDQFSHVCDDSIERRKNHSLTVSTESAHGRTETFIRPRRWRTALSQQRVERSLRDGRHALSLERGAKLEGGNVT